MHEDGCPAAVLVHDLADHLVELLIQPVDVAEVLLRLVLGPGGVFLPGSPEQVRLEIAAGEIENNSPPS